MLPVYYLAAIAISASLAVFLVSLAAAQSARADDEGGGVTGQTQCPNVPKPSDLEADAGNQSIAVSWEDVSIPQFLSR